MSKSISIHELAARYSKESTGAIVSYFDANQALRTGIVDGAKVRKGRVVLLVRHGHEDDSEVVQVPVEDIKL